MKNWFQKIYSAILLTFLVCCLSSCGADAFKTTVSTSSQSNLQTTQKECSCNSSYSPVCGIDGKNYDNLCWAQCQTEVAKAGHCQCSPTNMVCGSDNQNYTECDAEARKIVVSKFSPCESVGH